VLQAQHILALPAHERRANIPPHLLTIANGGRGGSGSPAAVSEEEDAQTGAGDPGAGEAAEGAPGAGSRKVLLLWFGPKAPEWQPSDQLKPFVAHRKQLIGERCSWGLAHVCAALDVSPAVLTLADVFFNA
jgi:hypothetical protein